MEKWELLGWEKREGKVFDEMSVRGGGIVLKRKKMEEVVRREQDVS